MLHAPDPMLGGGRMSRVGGAYIDGPHWASKLWSPVDGVGVKGAEMGWWRTDYTWREDGSQPEAGKRPAVAVLGLQPYS